MTKRLLILLVLLASPLVALATTDTITATGSWVAPTGVTSVTVDAWGGGGGSYSGGFSSSGAGGGGGAYSQKLNIAVTPGNSYTVTVGVGGTAGVFGDAPASTDGGDTWFSTSGTVLAKGGARAVDNANPGAGGASASGVGDTRFSGGNGIDDGGGGGGAGTTGNGGNASVPTGGAGTAVGGGNGGAADGGNGSTKGGAGAAGAAGVGAGGTSARGEVQITYTAATVSTVHTKVTFAKGTGYITKSTVYIK